MKAMTAKKTTIGQLAKNAGVGIDTVRFYERRGLLPEPERTTSGYRLYGNATVARIHFIRRAKQLGFTLDEIIILLRLQDQGGEKSDVRSLTQHKLEEIDAKIADLERIRSVLHKLSQKCSGKGSVAGCPIIEAIASMSNDTT
jgi:Hg(II)-responsive transcriptional regulator